MTTVAQVFALAVAATSLLAGLVGAGYWAAGRTGRAPWLLIRGAQVVAGANLVAALILLAARLHPAQDLYWLYASLPAAVGLFAEQIRIATAESVLSARELEDGDAVAALPPGEQRAVVTAIIRRELAVMTVAAFVCAFLALRAHGTV